MNQEKYYILMCNNTKSMSFFELHNRWYKCFAYMLKSFNVGFTTKSIKSIFYGFAMKNWDALHQEHTYYKDYTKDELIESFCSECSYISDRYSYDRLFRCHWLFLRAFDKELFKLRYPNL